MVQAPGQPAESSAPKRRKVQPRVVPKPVGRKAATQQPAATQQGFSQGGGRVAEARPDAATAAEAEQRPLSRMERMAVESGIDAAEMEEYY